MYFFYYFPVGINAKLRRPPVMTYCYAGVCALIYVLTVHLPGLVPIDFYNLIYVPYDGGVMNSIAAAFLHLGLFHLLGNLLYLVVFGRYVEDRMGPAIFAMLFLATAGIGNYAQGVFNTHVLHQPYMGIIGASGAVSGLLGAFTVRFFGARLRIAYWVFMPLQAYTKGGRTEIPALIAVILWFIMQVARGLIQIEGADTGVAYINHLSGFLLGVIVAVALGQFGKGRIERYQRRGDKHVRNGQPYAAQGQYIRYLTHNPEDASVYASLARSMVMSGNRDGAIKNYRKSCELYLEQLQRGKAEDVFREALRGHETFTLAPEAHLDLAFGLERNLKHELAVRAYENFEHRYPAHKEAPFALLRAAGLHRQTFDSPVKAEECYQKLVDRYPNDVWVDFAREQIRTLGLMRS